MSFPLGVIVYPGAGVSRALAETGGACFINSPSSRFSEDSQREDSEAVRSRSLPEFFRSLRTRKSKILGQGPAGALPSASNASSPAKQDQPVLACPDSCPRLKHIPIILPERASTVSPTIRRIPTRPPRPPQLITNFHASPSFERTSVSGSPSSAVDSPSPAPRLSPILQRGRRHVEIVIPPWTYSNEYDSELLLPHADACLDTGLVESKSSLSCIMSQYTEPSSLDNSASDPSSAHLFSFSDVGGDLSSVGSSLSSLGRRDEYGSMPEAEPAHMAQQPTPQQTPSAVIPPNAAEQTMKGASLSSLVCNVHRTTGREPHALVGATTTILGDKLFVFGGRTVSRSRPSLTSELFELDLITRHWTKIDAKGDVPSPRYFHSVCALGDYKLVCYGGMSPDVLPEHSHAFKSEAHDPQVTVMSDVHLYDVPTQTWSKVVTPEAPQGRYAHCAAILPSSAVFASAKAPTSDWATTDSKQNLFLDGVGGAEMVVVGGQDTTNHYIESISIFNLRSLKWTSTRPMSGRSCGAYRSVTIPLTSMSAAQIGAGSGRPEAEDEYDDNDDDGDATLSGSPMLIYTNYNFLDVKLDLQVRLPDGSLMDKPMRGAVSPPGLRFPSGGIIDNSFVVAGTFLTSSQQEYALWALDLRTLTWARIDTGSSVFSQGSWNRGVLWNRRNAFVVLGNRRRDLVDDYNNRRLNFSNICLVQLEAFGFYDNPRRSSPMSDYMSISAPLGIPDEGSHGGRQLSQTAEDLGELALGLRELCDMDFLAMDGTRLSVNTRLVARRWGSSFNALLCEGLSSLDVADTANLRPNASDGVSRNSSMTIRSNATTLVASPAAVPAGPPDVQSLPPVSRPRTLYLPHAVPTIQALIHYLYSSSLPAPPSVLATPQILCSLLQLARPYKIDGLLEAVIDRLHKSMDARNAAAIFNAAAMGAGGGDGIEFATGVSSAVHPPRTSSIAGFPIDGVMFHSHNGGMRNGLRIDTEVTNGRTTRNTLRPASDAAGETGSSTEEVDFSDSASTAASMASESSPVSNRSSRGHRDTWDGGWSAVVGLQKRGLRALVEGRRNRERATMGGDNGRVGLGIA